MEKRFRGIILAVIILIMSFGSVNAACFEDITEDNVFMTQEKGKGRCTLVAASMMLRRAMILDGKSGWEKITENSMKDISSIWTNSGLKWTFTYDKYSVDSVGGTGNLDKLWDLSDEDKENLFKSLLKTHPEGVVMWCKYSHNLNVGNHAVLLTDYTNGVFYCADPAKSSKRIMLKDASVNMSNALRYWFVKSPSLAMEKMNINPKTKMSYGAVKYGTNYYYINYDYVNWDEAKNICESYGGHLVTINDENEEKFVEKLNVDKAKLWIGGYRTSSGKWKWVTDEEFKYTKWKAAYPLQTASKKYLSLYSNCWKNYTKDSCTPVGYICEWEGYKISVNSNKIELYAGNTQKIDYTIKLINKVVDYKPKFSSLDSSVALVDENGNISGVKPGITKIKVKAGTESVECTVVVKPAKIINVSVLNKGTNYVTLNWDKMDNITGYLIYGYDSVNKKYVRVKKIMNPEILSYKVRAINKVDLKSKKTYKFKVRAYQETTDVIYYGKSSDAISVKLK